MLLECSEVCSSVSSKHLKSPPLENLAQYEGAETSGTQCSYLPGSRLRALALVVPKRHPRHPSAQEVYHPCLLTLKEVPMRSLSDLHIP